MLMYIFASVLMIVYLLIAGFALYMSYDEQIKTHNGNLYLKVLSFAACIAWPVTSLVVAASVLLGSAKRSEII